MWEPDDDGKWGPNYHDMIEQFFSFGYNNYVYDATSSSYLDRYNSTSTLIDDYHQNSSSNNSSYDQENNLQQYHPDHVVNNFDVLAVSTLQPEGLISGLSISDGGNQSSHQENQQLLQASSNAAAQDQFQLFITNQDWCYDPSSFNYYYDGGFPCANSHLAAGNEEEVETKQISKPSACCSFQNQSSCDIDKEENSCLEITNKPEFEDKLVTNTPDKITTVAHTPKVNGDIPSIDEASSDHQRLLERLKLFSYVESIVKADGNCQFRALSDQLYHTQEHHKSVRQKVVLQLKSNQKMYEGYVPMAYTDYLRQISKGGEWGDHVTLQAAADSYGVKILVLTSFKDTIFIEILPRVHKSKRVIFLTYWAEVHYNSMYPEGELRPSGIQKMKSKKKWWNFKNRPQAYLD